LLEREDVSKRRADLEAVLGEKYLGRLCRYAFYFHLREEDAKDIAQQTVTDLIGRCMNNPSIVPSWKLVNKVARDRIMTRFRREVCRKKAEQVYALKKKTDNRASESPDPSDELAQKERMRGLKYALLLLPPQDVELLVYAFWVKRADGQSLSQRQLADIFGCSEAWIRKRLDGIYAKIAAEMSTYRNEESAEEGAE
jgi:RNA polymerase sigma factor (sigma-70 family)